MKSEFNSFWSKHFRFDWKFGLILLFTVCAVRFAMVLKANVEIIIPPSRISWFFQLSRRLFFFRNTEENKSDW